jgi:20S proteasome alpha/beta subunit
MRTKAFQDLQDASDGIFGAAGEVVSLVSRFSPPDSNHGGSPEGSVPVSVPTLVIPEEAVEAQAAQGDPGGPGSVVQVAATSGGLTFNLIFDAAAMAAPASFRQGIQQAAAILSGAISDKITVNLKIDYSGTGGGAAAGPDNGQFVSYSTVKADLINNETPGDTSFNALPAGTSIQGQSNVAVWNAQLKLFGLLSPNDTTTDDGSATFATDINPNLLVGVALHELTHALGRVPYGPQPDIFDFYRFTSAGTRLFLNGATAPASYFSEDGGVTKLADLGRNSDSSDFLNSGIQGPNDAFNEFYTGSTIQGLTSIDKVMLDALGFHTMAPVTTTIESSGSTSLVQVGSNYFLDAISSGTGPELKYNGTPVVAGQFAPYVPMAVEQTAGGYEVALVNASSNLFSIWSTDSSGNFLSFNVLSGTSTALESLETSFQQDLNGDHVIGIVSATIESSGSTKLDQVGGNYFLDAISSGTGPELKYNGTPVVAGQFAPYVPMAVEQTAGGYEVAWKLAGSNQFSIWSTDSSGNFLSFNALSGTSTALESLETSFQQDLNGDHVIGVPAAPGPAPQTPVGAVTNDGFVFPPSVVASTGRADMAWLDGFSSSGSNAHWAELVESHAAQPPASLPTGMDGQDATSHHGVMTWIDAAHGDFIFR